jgi:hypothetical protein
MLHQFQGEIQYKKYTFNVSERGALKKTESLQRGWNCTFYGYLKYFGRDELCRGTHLF